MGRKLGIIDLRLLRRISIRMFDQSEEGKPWVHQDLDVCAVSMGCSLDRRGNLKSGSRTVCRLFELRSAVNGCKMARTGRRF